MKKIVLLAALAALFIVNPALADNGPEVSDNDLLLPSSWSLELLGGTTFGHFTFGSDITPHGGIRIRYSANPILSLYGTAGGGEFRSSGALAGTSFENRYYQYGLGARLNLLRMMTGQNSVTRNVGIYAQTGMGLIWNDVETGDSSTQYPGQDFSGQALLYQLGGGITFRIHRWLSFFIQGEANFSNSDLLDGYERQPGAPVNRFLVHGDAYINTSAGISIKLGSSSAGHVDWQRRDHRIDPLARSHEQSIQRMETQVDLTNTTMDTVHERVQMFERTLDDLSHVLTVVHADQLMTQNNQIERLQNRLQMLQSELDELSGQLEDRTREDRIQYYVVAGVYRSAENAESQLRELQATGFGQAEMIRDRGRNYYLVTYSGHENEAEASGELDRIRSEINPDSWIYVR